MDWATIRKHFKAERKRLHMTQDAVAGKGVVSQSIVSRIESDPTYVAEADSFIRAIEGLGLTPSEFFLAIEKPRAKQQESVLNEPPSSAITPNHGDSVLQSIDVGALADHFASISILLKRSVDAADNPAARQVRTDARKRPAGRKGGAGHG